MVAASSLLTKSGGWWALGRLDILSASTECIVQTLAVSPVNDDAYYIPRHSNVLFQHRHEHCHITVSNSFPLCCTSVYIRFCFVLIVIWDSWCCQLCALYWGASYKWNFSFLKLLCVCCVCVGRGWGVAPYFQKHVVVQNLQRLMRCCFVLFWW